MIIKRSWRMMYATVFCLLFSALMIAPAAEKPAVIKTENASSQFLRLRKDDKQQPLAFEACIVRYVPQDRKQKTPTVDLVPAVHIGEKSYYEQLNREFATYDAVLYELVAPEGMRVPKGGTKSDSIVSLVQKALKDFLELEFQLEMIDYTRPNMVHADMSPTQFAESMEKRGETVFSIFMRMFSAAMAQQSSETSMTDVQLLMALFDKNRALALKRIMADKFQSMDGMLTALDGPNGSTLISERNKTALEVLRSEIKAGKKKLAIFYGGGHMPDFDKRLRAEFGLVPDATHWLVAWDLKTPDKPTEPEKKP